MAKVKSPWLIATDANNTMNQSELEANTCNLYQVQSQSQNVVKQIQSIRECNLDARWENTLVTFWPPCYFRIFSKPKWCLRIT